MRRLTVPAVLGALACALALSACSTTNAPAPAPTSTPAASSSAQTAPGSDEASAAAVDACRAELDALSTPVIERLDVEHPFVTAYEGTMKTNGQPFRVVEFPALPNAATSAETPRFCIVARGDAQLISADNTAVWGEWGLPRPS